MAFAALQESPLTLPRDPGLGVNLSSVKRIKDEQVTASRFTAGVTTNGMTRPAPGVASGCHRQPPDDDIH